MPAVLVMTQAEVEADPERWHAERRKGIGASEIAAVLGICPPNWGSPFSLYHDKLLGEEPFDNDAMEYGRYMEEYIARKFGQQHPEMQVGPGGLYRSADRPWQMATYDRLALDAGHPSQDAGGTWEWPLAPVQCKTAQSADEWGSDPADGIVPDHYLAQVYQEMDVGDFDLGFLVVLFAFSRQVRTYVIERDAEALAEMEFMREQGELFMERLADRNPPPVDWTPATTRTLRRLHPDLEDRAVQIPAELARRYKAALRAEATIDVRKGQAVNEIMQRLGAARLAERDGLVVAQRRRYDQHRIDTKVLRAEYPDVAKACERTSPVDGLWPGVWVHAE